VSDELEIVEQPPPSIGSLAWLQLQEHVSWQGIGLPHCHRIPEGSTAHPERDGRCRLIRPDGSRCKAVATRLYGLCLVHAGGGGAHDIAEMSRRGNAARARLKARRSLLGIGTNRAADPRQLLRLAAHDRAETIAEAMLAPLDDGQLGSLARQGAALRVLDAAFPLATVSLDVELPADAEGMSSMGWAEMQALAAQLTSG